MGGVLLHHEPQGIGAESIYSSGMLGVLFVALEQVGCLGHVLQVAQHVVQNYQEVQLLENALV